MTLNDRSCTAVMRPPFMGRRGVVSSGHGLASLAGVEILRNGGNAFDAGVAAAMCLSILQPDYAGFVGVSPFIGYSAGEKRVLTYSGVGIAPRAATIELFRSKGCDTVPLNILSQLIPASVDTWVAVLKRLGTLGFSDVAIAARDLARDGFPAHQLMIDVITRNEEEIRKYPYNASIFFQTGGIPKLGERFVQKDAAKSLDLMMDAEREALRAGLSREEALEKARDVFYRGEIARAVDELHRNEGGLITYEDLSSYRGKWEEPLSTTYKDDEIFTTSTWTQGPLLLQCLNLLESFDLRSMNHNSPGYVHLVSSAIDLSMADRERFYGDPDFVDVPSGLWTKAYSSARRSLIPMKRAFREMPPHGDPVNNQPIPRTHRIDGSNSSPTWRNTLPDTTYVCAADSEGNLFSMTPSDGGFGSPMVPDYGVILGWRMSQFRLTPGHAASLCPGKRPTITPAPALALRKGKPYMAIGTPGSDQQIQAMLQVFLNVAEFDMNVQEAVEMPRFGSYNFPAWFAPHEYHPGRLCLETRLEKRVGDPLAKMGRDVQAWDDWTILAGGVCTVLLDLATGTIHGGADPRRESYAIGR